MKIYKAHYKIIKDNATMLSVTDYSDNLENLMKVVNSHVTQSYEGKKEIAKVDIKEIEGIEQAMKHVKKDYRKYGTLAAFHDWLKYYQTDVDEAINKIKE